MIKRISLSSLRSSTKDSTKIVKYTTCSNKIVVDDDLDEVAVISNVAAPESVRYGSSHGGHHGSTANGPRVVPGIITAGMDRSKVISSSTAAAPAASSIRKPSTVSNVLKENINDDVEEEGAGDYDDDNDGGDGNDRQTDNQSDLNNRYQKIHAGGGGGPDKVITTNPPPQYINGKQQQQQQLLQPLYPMQKKRSVNQVTIGPSSTIRTSSSTTTAATTTATATSGPGTVGIGPISPNDLESISKKTREQRRREIKKEFEKWENSGSIHHKSGCNWSFVFDPSGRLCYYWSLIVSIAFLYNFWTIIYRCAFQEINEKTVATWFALDYFSDFIYILDIAVNFRTGYLEEGVLQTDSIKLRQHYMNCTLFYIDCLCLLPLDFLYLSIGFKSILRCFRLVKIYRFWAFLDRTERHTNYPNIFRTLSLLHYILAIFHWNACLSHIIHVKDGFGSRDWFTRLKNKDCEGVTCDYLHAMYWSVLALTTIGDLPTPRTKSEYLFLIMQLVFGLFLFATVLGHVANIVTNVSAARKEFQAKLDAVKTYMRMRRVPDHIQTKVIRWFDYLWMTQKSSDEERSVGCLPDKLKAEIAIHVHLDTLKRVEIFQNTEAGFLCELVLRLRPVLFSPGDYICRKGEVGKEMYIVNRGKLQVVTDNGKTVLATLRAGSYFGEISILNMGTAGNRRTASVRSVGYSDLFCLNKQDMWDVLKDYPAARVRLEAIAVKRLEKYRKEPLKKIAMGRSKSTPGLVESKGKIPVPGNVGNELQMRENSASTATLLKAETEDGSENGLTMIISSGKTNDSTDQQQQQLQLQQQSQQLQQGCGCGQRGVGGDDCALESTTSSMDTMKASESAYSPHHHHHPLAPAHPHHPSSYHYHPHPHPHPHPHQYHHHLPTHSPHPHSHPPHHNLHHPHHHQQGPNDILVVNTNNNTNANSNNNKSPQYSPILAHHNQHQQQAAQQTLQIYSQLLSPNLAIVTNLPSSATTTTTASQTSQTSSQYHLGGGGGGRSSLTPSPQPLLAGAAGIIPPPSIYSPFNCTISPAQSTNQLPIFSSSSANSLLLLAAAGATTTSTTTNQPEDNSGAAAAVAASSGSTININDNIISKDGVEFPSQDALLSEIKRLRERLLTLETENASMSMKLNQQQWQVENRLAEIEHQINSAAVSVVSGGGGGGGGSGGSGSGGGGGSGGGNSSSCSGAQLGFTISSNSSNASVEDNERNKESII